MSTSHSSPSSTVQAKPGSAEVAAFSADVSSDTLSSDTRCSGMGPNAEKIEHDHTFYTYWKNRFQCTRAHLPEDVIWSDEQKLVMDKILKENQNLVLSGKPGTGKSTLMRRVLLDAVEKYGSDAVGVTAATGIAASHLGGQTIHSWSGIGIGTFSASMIARRMFPDTRKRWKECKMLIIDEAFMLDHLFVEKLDEIGQLVRGKVHVPFGGVQIILVGDPMQIPPVSLSRPIVMHSTERPVANNPVIDRKRKWNAQSGNSGCGGMGAVSSASAASATTVVVPKMLFQSNLFSTWFPRADQRIRLEKVFRQSEDPFLAMLNRIRENSCSREDEAFLQSLRRPLAPVAGIIPTRLYSLNRDVDVENGKELARLGKPLVTYKWNAKTYEASTEAKKALDQLCKNCPAQESISLCVGAQVIVTRNDPRSSQRANGTRAVIVGFVQVEENRDPMFACCEDKECTCDEKLKFASRLDTFHLIPETTICATTASNHKNVVVDWTAHTPIVYTKGIEIDTISPDESKPVRYPVVRYLDGQLDIILPHTWIVEQTKVVDDLETRRKRYEVTPVASITQIPLRLAWAITIHRCQGMTLDLVEMDLANAFEAGMAYTALSRARSAEGLRVLSITPHAIRTNNDALRFYKQELMDIRSTIAATEDASSDTFSLPSPS